MSSVTLCPQVDSVGHPFVDLPVPASPLSHVLKGEAYPLESVVPSIMEQPAPAGWQPTAARCSLYLDMAEVIVRTITVSQNKDGGIVDRVTGREWGQATPRFASPGAYLLAQGRIPELREQVERAMSYSCERLAMGRADAPDFWMRELASAFLSLRRHDKQSPLLEGWSHHLRKVAPERQYLQVRPDGTNLDQLNNWTVYAAAGEALREWAGLVSADSPPVSGMAFLRKYIPAQLKHFTEYGMYRDPHDPITYDLTTRLQFTVAILAGYRDEGTEDLQELLRRGALTQLFYMSPLGLVPYGGRSSQFQFQEAIVCALCEIEARRYAKANPPLAGAFKRQARLSALAIRPWILDENPFRYSRNHFDIDTNWGAESYAHYSCYGLTAASFLALAAEYADDTIAESPCPAERGGFVLSLEKAFHKVFVSAAGYHLEIDTRADFNYDATGLGRIHRTGLPFLLGAHAPFTRTPNYKLPDEAIPESNFSWSAAWTIDGERTDLASLSEGLTSEIESISIGSSTKLCLAYRWRNHLLREAYVVKSDGIEITVSASCGGRAAEQIDFAIPVPLTDGQWESEISPPQHGELSWKWGEGRATILFDPGRIETYWDGPSYANRNGIHRTFRLVAAEKQLRFRLHLSSSAQRNLPRQEVSANSPLVPLE